MPATWLAEAESHEQGRAHINSLHSPFHAWLTGAVYSVSGRQVTPSGTD
jgi:hypothetical protein